MKIVLLNGPPRSGKTACAKMLTERIGEDRCGILGFSYHLKHMVHAIYGLDDRGDPDMFDAVKSESLREFFFSTPREAYIWWSEKAAKVAHGDRFFGDMWLKRAKEMNKAFMFVPDCGFHSEVIPLIREYGPENLLLCRIHREGTSFANDSRNYIDLRDSDVLQWQVANLKDEPEYMVDCVLEGMDAAFGVKL